MASFLELPHTSKANTPTRSSSSARSPVAEQPLTIRIQSSDESASSQEIQ